MAKRDNEAIVRRIIEEAFNQGKLGVIDEVISPDYVNIDPAAPEPIRGPAGMKEMVEGYRAAFPDLKLTINDQVSSGDKVVTRWTATGTHKGDLWGLAPTGSRRPSLA